jgi:hypothetical protein
MTKGVKIAHLEQLFTKLSKPPEGDVRFSNIITSLVSFSIEIWEQSNETHIKTETLFYHRLKRGLISIKAKENGRIMVSLAYTGHPQGYNATNFEFPPDKVHKIILEGDAVTVGLAIGDIYLSILVETDYTKHLNPKKPFIFRYRMQLRYLREDFDRLMQGFRKLAAANVFPELMVRPYDPKREQIKI